MCGKETVVRDEYDGNNKSDKKQQRRQENLEASNIIIEEIDGKYNTFDTANCALMFKRFSAIYGSNFVDE
jgi:hypothetical protein